MVSFFEIVASVYTIVGIIYSGFFIFPELVLRDIYPERAKKKYSTKAFFIEMFLGICLWPVAMYIRHHSEKEPFII